MNFENSVELVVNFCFLESQRLYILGHFGQVTENEFCTALFHPDSPSSLQFTDSLAFSSKCGLYQMVLLSRKCSK